MEIHGVLMEFHGIPWNAMQFHGVSTEFHVMPWNSLDYPWNLACFKEEGKLNMCTNSRLVVEN